VNLPTFGQSAQQVVGTNLVALVWRKWDPMTQVKHFLHIHSIHRLAIRIARSDNR
jgi:hypothetical protein